MTTKTVKPSAAETARKFYDAAKAGDWKIDARNTIVTITRHFTAGDNAAFVACDGGGLGGHVALRSGTFRMNVSGVGKRVVSEILKLQAANA